MRSIIRFASLSAGSVMLALVPAIGAGLTHAVGASATDVAAIKTAVTGLRHGEPASIDWYIAVNGADAVVYAGCTPGACNQTQLIRRDGRWVVTCYTVEGKGRIGTCSMTPDKAQSLRRAALSSYHGS
jgi:hypothetical protein